ncbi:unnamed protein product [Meganyctiphanes norvegica]|uniref:Uncharacterized protein n=1 Tax=Meganyctiphanes norvegica TaxID=48144 RepID=A0AAV2QBX3_MEGNR
MKRELDNEAHLEDSKKGRLENGLDNPHMVNNMQQQFLHQQHQYLQHQLQQLQQQQLQQQHPPEHHWTMQGQCAPRPALPAHMLPYAMQSYLQGPYTQPAPTPTPSIPRHHNEFLSYPSPYQNDPNALQLVQNPYMLQQQTVDGQKFVNFPDHTPSPSPSPNPPPLSPDVGETSPSPSPNPPLSPNIGEVQAPEVSNAAYYNPTVAMPIEHSKQVVDYSMACVQSVTPVEYPSPAQSPIPPVEHPTSVIITNSKGIPQSIPQSPLPTVEHPAAAVKSKSKGIPQVINNYTEHHPLELIDASMRRPNSENIYSSKDLPQIRTPYAEIPFAVSISSAGGVYSSNRVDIASDLSSSTTTMEVPFVNVTEATTPSKGSLAYGYSHQSSVHGHFKELDTNPEVIDSSHSAPHSPAGIPNPLSPYTSRLPNPPPNSPMVPHEYPTSDSQSINNDRYLASHSGFSSDNISKVHHYYSGVKTSISHDVISKSSPVTEKSLVEHAVNISEKISNLIEDPKKINLISASPQHRSSFIAVNSPVVQRNDVQNNSFDSSNNNGYIGAFSALIKSEEREQSNYGANLEREMYEKCEDQLNHQKFMKNQEGDAEEGNQEERRMQNKSDYGKYCTEEKKKDDAKKKEERKPFSFSPYLYQYLDSKQREVGIETIEWSSQLCTPPESPSATNSSTPASSPTDTAPVPLITLTPCTTYSCVSTEYFSNSAMSELRDDQGALCQGDKI